MTDSPDPTASSGSARLIRPRETAENELARRPLRLWLSTIMLVAYYIAVECSYRMEMAMFPRFVTRMLALLVLLVYFMVWGLTRKQFTRAQRWSTFALVVGVWIVAGLLNDPQRNMFAMAMEGFPCFFALSVAWLWLTPRRAPANRLAGIRLLAAVTFGVMALQRWDGLDGRQRPQLSWRWIPTAEQVFLNERAAHAGDATADAKASAGATDESADDEGAPALLAGDWPAFRGGDQQSVVAGLKLADWKPASPAALWRRRVGPAWSSVIAVGDRLFTQEQRDREEVVVCYDAKTGRELWASGAGARFDEPLSGAGPRATPTWSAGRIYAFGATGQLRCLSAATGKELWSQDVLREAGGAVPQWGLSVSPLVVDELVVVFAGGKDGRGLLAFDAATGKQVWQCPAGTVTFSSPQVITLAGVRQIVMQDEAGLYGARIEDGSKLWEHPCSTGGKFQPMLQYHRVDDADLIVGWENGIRRIRVSRTGDKWSTSDVWQSNYLKAGFNDFHIHKDAIYGLGDGILCCLDLADGHRRWKGGRYGYGQLLLLPEADELLVLGETGDVVRVAADPTQHRELASFKAIDGKTWNHPLIAHGRLVVRNDAEMACFDLK